MKKIYTREFWYILPACLLLFHSCTNPVVYDPQVFHYNQASGISSLDPAFARDQSGIWICHQLYDGLLSLDDSLHVQACIARKWTVSQDGLDYTFTLRSDVWFHADPCFENHTRRLTAADVVYSLKRIAAKETASPGAWIFHDRLSNHPFEAPDDSTFILHLAKPFPPVLGMLTMQYCSVVPKEAVEKYGPDFRSHPVGTGPFCLKIWREGSALILIRNEHYFENEKGHQLPYIKGVRVSFMASKKSEFMAFRQGKLDFISGLDISFQDEVIDLNGALKEQWKRDYNMEKCPYLNTEYLGFLLNHDSLNPFSDKRIRQAINYGIDRQAIIRYLRNGIGKPAFQGFLPPGLPGFDDSLKGFCFRPDSARLLLKEAGHENGAGLPFLRLYTNDTYKEMALLVSKQLEQTGIRVNVEVVEPGILRQWMSLGKALFFRGSWIADYPDAESFFAVFYSLNGAPPNYTHFTSHLYDSLYRQALAETDDSKRIDLYRQLDRIIISEAPVVPLYYDEVLRFSQKWVKGLKPNALNLPDLRRVQLEAH